MCIHPFVSVACGSSVAKAMASVGRYSSKGTSCLTSNFGRLKIKRITWISLCKSRNDFLDLGRNLTCFKLALQLRNVLRILLF